MCLFPVCQFLLPCIRFDYCLCVIKMLNVYMTKLCSVSAPSILQHISELELYKTSNILLRKLTVKVVQRIGLSFLKARVATWR